MSYESERQSIEQRFETQWAATLPVRYDNVEFEPPATAYVELQIHNGDAFAASTGGSTILERSVGIISMNLFGQKGTGTATLKGHVDTLCAIFRNANFDSIQCRSPNVTRLGEQDGRYVINVSVPFYRDAYF